MRKPAQPLLGIVAPPPRKSGLKDRGFGSTETPGQRSIRLSRDRAAHERRKAEEISAPITLPRLGRMP